MMTYEDAERILCNQCIHNVHCMIHDEECEPMKRLKQPQWIPCSERLPDSGKCILICSAEGGVAEGYYSQDGLWYQFRWKAVVDNVIAWMPLPEPYKEGSDE